MTQRLADFEMQLEGCGDGLGLKAICFLFSFLLSLLPYDLHSAFFYDPISNIEQKYDHLLLITFCSLQTCQRHHLGAPTPFIAI